MSLAILADTHDNLPALQYFVEYYREQNVQRMIHAGDLISPFMVPVLEKLNCPVDVVFGNNDGDRQTLRQKAKDTSVEFHEAPYTFKTDDCYFLVSHRPEDLPETIPDRIDYVIHGHTHQPLFEEKEECTWINPGEAGGWLHGVSRGVQLHLETGTIDVEVVPRP